MSDAPEPQAADYIKLLAHQGLSVLAEEPSSEFYPTYGKHVATLLTQVKTKPSSSTQLFSGFQASLGLQVRAALHAAVNIAASFPVRA